MAESSPESRPDTLRPVLIVLAIIAVYMAVRETVALFLPTQYGFNYMLIRQSVKTGPRLLGLAAIGWFSFRSWNDAELGLHWRGRGVALTIVFWSVVFPLLMVFVVVRWDWKWFHIPIVLVIDAVVGIFEELSFRGALLNTMKERYGTTKALWGTAALFTFFHLGAQPFDCWPGIFLFGLLWGRLRLQGMSLYWLMAVHGVIDVTADLVDSGYIIYQLVSCLGLLLWYWLYPPVFPSQNPSHSAEMPVRA